MRSSLGTARLGRAAALAVAAAGGTATAQGGTFTWRGQSADANWTRGTNWVGNAPPDNDGSAGVWFDDAAVGSAADLSPVLDVNYNVYRLQFQGGSSFNIASPAGAVLTVQGGGLSQLSVAPQTIGAKVVVGTDQIWTLAGPLVAAGGVDLNNRALTATTAGSTTLGGALSGSGTLYKSGDGTLTLTDPSTFGTFTAGAPLTAVTVRSGTLAVAGPAAALTLNSFVSIGLAPGDTGGVALANGGRVGFGTYYTYTSTAYPSGSDFVVGDRAASLSANIAASLTVQDAGTKLDAGYMYLGKGALNGNGVTSGVVNQTGGTVAARQLFFVGSYGTGTYNLSGGTLGSGGAATAATLADGLAAASVLGARSGATGTLNQTGGTLSVAGDLYVGENGNGTVTQTAGTAAVGGTLVAAAATGTAGTVDLSAGPGTLAVTGPIVVGRQGAGTLKVGPGATVSASGLVIDQVPKTQVTSRVTQTGGTVTLGAGGLTSGTFSGTNGFRSSAVYVLGGGVLATPFVSQPGSPAVPFTFDFNGGTLRATTSTASFLGTPSAVVVQAGGAVVDTNGFNVVVYSTLAHDAALTAADGGLTKVGAGTLTLSSAGGYTGPTNVSAGTLTFGLLGKTVTARPLVGGLSVAAGATAAIAAAPSSAARTVLVPSSLSVAGTLDVANNDLVVPNGSVADVTALAAAGFAGGTWAGPGLASSAAAADPARLSAVGVIPNGSTYATFDGLAVAATDVLARFTVYGDANLDGAVTAADFTRLDAGAVGGLTGWANGDFNYDGVVDGADYALADNAFNRQAGVVAAPAAAVSAVPEPATVGVISLAAVAGLGRRRRPVTRWPAPPRRRRPRPTART